MAIDLKEIVVHIRNTATFSVTITYQYACAHPFITCSLPVSIMLYRAFPSLFAFMIPYSPVILCTLILLRSLLIYDRPNNKNQVVTTSAAGDEQKSVMDLGYSEEESSRRLESMIAKRRLRKLQRYETEKNMLDINKYYRPAAIPSVAAPRLGLQNPDETSSLSPFPDSAPSMMLHARVSPFDPLADQADDEDDGSSSSNCSLSKEYMSHHDFITCSQRQIYSRRLQSFKSDVRAFDVEPEHLGPG